MGTKIKPIRFKVHQKQTIRGDSSLVQTFQLEIQEKGLFGWRHKAWVDRRNLSDNFYPSDEACNFLDTFNFDRAIKNIEDHYEWERWRAVTSIRETNYIYEKNS